MTRVTMLVACTLLLECIATVTFAAQSEITGNSVTIYSSVAPGSIPPEIYRQGGAGQPVSGYAVVRHERDLNLNSGRNTVRFREVAALIDPTTVQFESLTAPKSTSVIEQNFQFDLVSTEKLLAKYVDRVIAVDQVRGNSVETFRGTLLSTVGGLVLRREDGSIQTLPSNAGVALPDLPGGLITKPTLMWDINTNRGGTHKTRVSYETAGITWWADYLLTYSDGANANQCKLDIAAWVSILNQSGASYLEAKLKLIAGDLQRIDRRYSVVMARSMLASAAAPGFQEKEFFEYHLYTLGRPTTLPDNSTKQIELFPAVRGVACEKILVYQGQSLPNYPYGSSPYLQRELGFAGGGKVDVYVKFKNSPESGMGMPLPLGRIRVSKLDTADKTLEFIGEDVIKHTPRNEQVLIKLGSAFDIVGERRQVNFSMDNAKRIMTEEIEIKVRNQKSEAVQAIVSELLPRWNNWRITEKSHDYQKIDARTIHFPVKLPPQGEVVISYTATYTW